MAKQPISTKTSATVKKVVAKKAVATTKKTATKKTTTAKAPAPKRAVKSAPVTTIIAKLDAGYGNELYLRGNGAGLSWDTGILMMNTSMDEWVWKSTSVTTELEFKVLLNDSIWASGPNGVVFPGSTVVFEPAF